MSFQCHNCKSFKCPSPYIQDCRDYYMGNPGSFDYYRCPDCELMQLWPVPHNLKDFYSGYQVHKKKSVLHGIFRKLFMYKAYYHPKHLVGKTVLDYGCGDGWYIDDIKRAGGKPVGLEVDLLYAQSLEYKLGIQVVHQLSQLEGNQFDVITLNFVLEHLVSPKSVLKDLLPHLVAGGLLYITIPNYFSKESRIFGRYWHGLDAPRHISFYSEGQISRLLRELGLDAVSISKISVPTGFGGSICHLLFKGFSYPVFAGATMLGVLFNLVINDGCFVIVARKP
jgi:SAM-dependent methyltransferase